MILRSLRERLNSYRWYRNARHVQKTGLIRYAAWHARERLILRSPPVRTRHVGDSTAPCEVRLMTCKRDWRLALWAAKSFYYFARVDWPISFHDGGGLNRSIRDEVQRHFPAASIIGWDDATKLVQPRLLSEGLENVAVARLANVMVRKLVDFAALTRAPNMVCFDSDVLFVGEPADVVRLGSGRPDRLWFNRDSHSMYSITGEQAKDWFGLVLPEHVNAGLSVMSVRLVDFAFLNGAFAPGRIPVNRDVFPEQTVCALLSARLGPAFLPPEYSVATGTPPLDVRALRLVSRHYVCPVRYLLYDEGIPFLTQQTNLLGRQPA